jgi:hypothetical protein
MLIAGLALVFTFATAIEFVRAAEPADSSRATNGPGAEDFHRMQEFFLGTDPNHPEPPAVTVNGGRRYSNSLTISIQPSTTSYPYIFVGTDMFTLMTNATMLDISGGPVEYTLPDKGDGQYELYMQYSDAGRQSHSALAIRTVTIDRTPPVVYIASPPSDAVLDQAFITLRAVAADPNPIVPDAFRPLSIWVNGERFWDRQGTNIVIERFPVPTGTSTFSVTIMAVDEAGNTNQTAQTWRVDTSTATNAPRLLSVNLPERMSLPDAGSIWVEGDVDNEYALVHAVMSAATGAVTTNSLNVRGRHYEGLVTVESGTNQLVLVASDAAGNASSNSFTIVRANHFRGAITSPAFGQFATAPSNYVSGYVSAKYDEGLPTETKITEVYVNGVAAVLSTTPDANGNLTFTTTNAIPLGVPITATIGGPGIPEGVTTP